MTELLTDAQWTQYEHDGFLMLGQLLSDDEVAALQHRLSDIMLGKAPLNYDNMVMQRDNAPGETQGPQSRGFKGPSLNYRVVIGLEYDPVFLSYIQRPLFCEICARAYGASTAITSYRSFVMNKSAGGGSKLLWHQDRFGHLSHDPLVTVWTALDPTTKANGCLQVIPGTHKFVINPDNDCGFITGEQLAEQHPDERKVYIELKPGEVVLLHNWLLHSSDVNQTDKPRRGLSVCYMDAATRDLRPVEERTHVYDQDAYPIIFGPGALSPSTLSDKAAA